MKVLISTAYYAGHINPMQSIAAELVKRGHTVIWSTGAEYEKHVSITGAQFNPSNIPAINPLPKPGTTGLAAAKSTLSNLFLANVPHQIAEYSALSATHGSFSLIITDLFCHGAAIFHALQSPSTTSPPLKWVTLGINPLVTLDSRCPPWGIGWTPPTTLWGRMMNSAAHTLAKWFLYRPLNVEFERIWRDAGAGATLPAGKGFYEFCRSPFLHLQMGCKEFEYPRDFAPEVKFIGALGALGDGTTWTPPEWWEAFVKEREEEVKAAQDEANGKINANPFYRSKPKKTIIHLTQGTLQSNNANPQNLINPTIAALKRLHDPNIILIITTPPSSDASKAFDIPNLPSNIHITPYIPHSILLPYVHIMITNSGYNGVLAALSHGVPLICAGTTEDKADVAARVAWCGIGVDLKTEKPSVGQIEGALRAILGGAKYKEKADMIQECLGRAGGAREAAGLMETLVGNV